MKNIKTLYAFVAISLIISLVSIFLNLTEVDNPEGSVGTGRVATYVIAVEDAPAIWRNQADLIVTGDADDELNSALAQG